VECNNEEMFFRKIKQNKNENKSKTEKYGRKRKGIDQYFHLSFVDN